MKFSIEPLRPDETDKACAVIKQAFDGYIASDYPPEGIAEFYRFANAEAMKARAAKNIQLAAKTPLGEIAGVIELRDKSHICLLFTAPAMQRQGVARALLAAAIAGGAKPPLSVNSSPFAVPVYRRLGFAETASEQQQNGIRFIPMTMQAR